MDAGIFTILAFIKKKWSVALLIGLLSFAFLQSMETLEPERLDQIILESDKPIHVTALSLYGWSFTMNALNPTWRYNSTFWDGYVVPINDIPYPDATDMWLMLFLVWPAVYVVKKLYKKNTQTKYRIKLILILFLWIIITWFFTKWAYYQLYLDITASMGFTQAEAIAARENHLLGIENVKTVLLVVALLGSVAILDLVRKKKK